MFIEGENGVFIQGGGSRVMALAVLRMAVVAVQWRQWGWLQLTYGDLLFVALLWAKVTDGRSDLTVVRSVFAAVDRGYDPEG